jgi:histone H3/H4
MAGKANYVVKSMVKARIAKGKCHSSSDLADALNGMVEWYLDQATKRAKANGRKTVRGHDIVLM